MRRISRETVQRILDAADIVDVVSDFVTLKRRGANYIGLCPFHNERTPSFSVSKSKGICKCFSCGKGGSPVNFLMELEQMNYNEALRYLAKKYNIEIEERELTDKERQEETERESMLAVNRFAMEHFERVLNDTADGRDIGLAYFRERGINDAMLKRFRLGYALEANDDLFKAATSAGFSEQFLVATGLCNRNDRGRVYDRFRGRVIYPVLSISGNVVAFGGRTLRKDKEVAKYVNSPESVIYSKRRELYGLYQARQAIVKQNKCILVEGYMDVISMHQSGVENVVASSGTSLTEEQVRLIHRFTENITVIYDSDPAGIKASLRGIDMLLAEGMKVKVLSLPDGDDPDSFAQSHSSTQVEEYLSRNETDFIMFKTRILLKDVGDDPIARARVITDIVRSISVIPDSITRSVYISECSNTLGISDKVLTLQVKKFMDEAALKQRQQNTRAQNLEKLEGPVAPPAPDPELVKQLSGTPGMEDAGTSRDSGDAPSVNRDDARLLEKLEREVLRYVLKYGMLQLTEACDEEGNVWPLSVIEYVDEELRSDAIVFIHKAYSDAYNAALKIARATWDEDIAAHRRMLEVRKERSFREGLDAIRAEGGDVGALEAKEIALRERVESEYARGVDEYSANYIERQLVSSPDDSIRALATSLVSDRYVLSKVHTKYSHVETEQERLEELVPRAIYELKDGILECRIRRIRRDIAAAASDPSTPTETIRELMARNMELDRLKAQFAKYLGDRIIAPRK